MDPKLIFPFTVNSLRDQIINFDGTCQWGYQKDDRKFIDLKTYNSVDWGINQHPKENGHKIVADFLLAQIKERYILT